MTGVTQRIGATVALVMLLASCYLPNDFTSEIRISRHGDYAMTYVGDLIYASLYRDISQHKLSGEQIDEKVAVLIRDLQRDKTYDPTGRQAPRPLFTEIEHEGNGRFHVRYEREGSVDADALVTFVRRNNNILSIRSGDGVIVIRANALSASDSQRLMALGLDMKGEFRVVADGEVIEHNANSVRPYAGHLVYVWNIDNALAPAPRLVMKHEPRRPS